MSEPQEPKPTSRRRPWRIALVSLGVVVVLLLGGVGVVVATFDPNSLKPRIQDAVRQATGRDLTLSGEIGVKLSLWPTIAVHDVAFANPPGFSRPHMVTLRTLELRLGLLPLLSRRVEIERLVLVAPDIRLEVNAAGQRNWVMARPASEPPRATSLTVTTPTERTEPALFAHIADLRIENGALTWHDAGTGRSEDLGIDSFRMGSASASSPVMIEGLVTLNSVALTLKGQTGPLSRLMPGATGPAFPVDLTATIGGATVKLSGAIADPGEAKGYDLEIALTIPDTAPLRPLVPNVTIPGARDVALSLRLRDDGLTLPVPSAITLKTGPIDLADITRDVRIDQISVSAPASDQPITLSFAGRRGTIPVSLSGTIGHPGLDPAALRPVPVDLRVTAADAVLTLKGRINSAATLSGLALDIGLSIPSLADLSSLAGQTLPPLRSIELQGRMTDAAGGLRNGAAIKAIRLRLPEADLSGEITVDLTGKPSVTATLASQRVDADALVALLGLDRPVQAPAGAPGAPAGRRAERGERLIPDTKLPFDQLQAFNADLRLSLDALRLAKADYKAITAHLMIRDGHLRLDPFTATTPEGRVTGTVTADATGAEPRVHVTANAPALALASVLAAAGARPIASGQIEVRADLAGTGDTPASIAASLSGHASLAMAGGTLDTNALGGSLGTLGKDLAILDLMGRGGGVADIRCLAIRFDAQGGIARSRALLLSTSLLTADGGGAINLRNEMLDLSLRPQGRIGGTGFRVPVKIGGPLRAPRVAVDAAGTAEANAEKLAGIIIGGATPLGALGGLLGAETATGGGGGNPCPAALALARGGSPVESAQDARPPATPAPNTAPPNAAPPAARPSLPDPGRMLRQLFR